MERATLIDRSLSNFSARESLRDFIRRQLREIRLQASEVEGGRRLSVTAPMPDAALVRAAGFSPLEARWIGAIAEEIRIAHTLPFERRRFKFAVSLPAELLEG